MANLWLKHLAAFYAKNKSKMSYSQAMKAAKASYTKVGKPSKAGRKKKSQKK
jgi:hypothetical protein